jgi:DNA repair exonuclease SbcCD nuclease subunit
MSDNKQGKRLKFLHCSDVHLDTPFLGLPADKSEERRRELRATFMRMMEFIRERAIDYVLISGDLFDSRFATNRTAELIIREFRSCPKTKFIIAPGMSDPYDDNSVYTSGRLSDNCYVFDKSSLSRFYFEEDKVAVYGWAFMGDPIYESPIADNHVDDVSMINVVCGYCDVDGEIESGLCPIPSSDMARFGADYYAFGSRHGKTEFIKKAGSMYSYSGSLECTGFDHPYVGGVKLLNIDYNDGELAIDGKHVSFGHLQFMTETIDITGVDANNEITNRISRLISAKKYGSQTALRVELVGSVSPRFQVPRTLESDAFGLYYFSVIDKTVPLYGTEKYKRDMSVAGEIYRRLLPLMESEDEEERLVSSRAFRVALAALEKKEIDF